MCQSAYQRFRVDPGWGTVTKGGFQTIRGKLVYDGPLREVPYVPSGNWFRYIVRERLLRGLCRYPYRKDRARSVDTKWFPDRMPPWNDVHMVPQDIGAMKPEQAIALGLVAHPHTQPDPRLSDIGPWGPPVQGL